jgi:hypothetical protein
MGVTATGKLNSGGLGRVHFNTGTNLLYSDSGVTRNPVGPAQVGTFSSGVREPLISESPRLYAVLSGPVVLVSCARLSVLRSQSRIREGCSFVI